MLGARKIVQKLEHKSKNKVNGYGKFQIFVVYVGSCIHQVIGKIFGACFMEQKFGFEDSQG